MHARNQDFAKGGSLEKSLNSVVPKLFHSGGAQSKPVQLRHILEGGL